MVNKKKAIFFGAISLVVVILDQLLKWMIIKFNPELNLKILSIHLVKNTGAAFGILQGKNGILAVISLVVALALIFFYKEIPKEKIAQVFYALFLGGVIGNLIDRFFRTFVVDFIDLGWWPAFNIADAAISIAAVGLIIFYLKYDT